ncbi:spore germination protein [Anaerobacillus sp. MEB173]|uniref:spore germination protein n=1 Tax=Anaerobacillus sp. MEB173 TaxID=3383345 RepID=UPI003F8E9FBE
MITSPKDQITTSQAVVIVINYIVAVGILTLPRVSVEQGKTPDAWIAVILGGLIAMIAGVIIVKLSQQFPNKTFYQYSQDIVGKWAGKLLSLLIIGYFLLTAGFQVRSLGEVTDLYLLHNTPPWAITIPFMWVGIYLILGGINPIARLFEIIFPITIIIFLLVASMSFGIIEIENLRPVLGLGIMPVLKGIKTTALAFTGIEIMLLLLAFMKQPNKAVKVVLVGVSIPLCLYVITVVLVIGAFSVDGVVTRTWPTLDLIRSFEITGLIFERFESLLLVIWIMQIFATFTITYYAATLGLAQLFQKRIQPFMYGLLPVIYIVSIIPKNTTDLFKIGDLIGNVGLFLFGILPLLLLVVWRVKEGKHEAKP